MKKKPNLLEKLRKQREHLSVNMHRNPEETSTKALFDKAQEKKQESKLKQRGGSH